VTFGKDVTIRIRVLKFEFSKRSTSRPRNASIRKPLRYPFRNVAQHPTRCPVFVVVVIVFDLDAGGTRSTHSHFGTLLRARAGDGRKKYDDGQTNDTLFRCFRLLRTCRVESVTARGADCPRKHDRKTRDRPVRPSVRSYVRTVRPRAAKIVLYRTRIWKTTAGY